MKQNNILKRRTVWSKHSIKLCLLFFSLFLSVNLFAQSGSVRGIVVDGLGDEVIGATVMVKGTNNGTITDVSGQFILSNLKQNDVFRITYIGYRDQEVTYTGQQDMRIILQESIEALDEVVVVGYGSLSKREVSSSIVQVNRDDFQQGAASNPMEMLQGRVAGLSVNFNGQLPAQRDRKYEWYPLPESALMVNPGLVQNPLWQ